MDLVRAGSSAPDHGIEEAGARRERDLQPQQFLAPASLPTPTESVKFSRM